MKLIITHIENIAFNHQVVTVRPGPGVDDMLVQIHLKNSNEFINQDQIGKEFTGFQTGMTTGTMFVSGFEKAKKGIVGLFK